MTPEQAIRILDSETSLVAVEELKYYAGFNRDKVIDQIMDAMDMGADALRKSTWIPRSERLPEEPEYGVDGYIVQSKDVAEPYSAYWGEDGTWTDSDCNVIKDVIAWMPLPEPYKESE